MRIIFRSVRANKHFIKRQKRVVFASVVRETLTVFLSTRYLIAYLCFIGVHLCVCARVRAGLCVRVCKSTCPSRKMHCVWSVLSKSDTLVQKKFGTTSYKTQTLRPPTDASCEQFKQTVFHRRQVQGATPCLMKVTKAHLKVFVRSNEEST
jgi:hypothetical protein